MWLKMAIVMTVATKNDDGNYNVNVNPLVDK
jgi:hypothetical protein